MNMGLLLAAEGRTDESTAAINKAIELNPDLAGSVPTTTTPPFAPEN
jgi:hypothetical protein